MVTREIYFVGGDVALVGFLFATSDNECLTVSPWFPYTGYGALRHNKNSNILTKNLKL